jgi:8-oxo-dGTP pyrophosphatase MutT (NUDIX family)
MTNFTCELACTLELKPDFKAAGVILHSVKSNRYLFVQRGNRVMQPRTWAGFGGEIDPGETAEEAVIRELKEEAGYSNAVKLKKVFTFNNGKFTYTNYIGDVWDEFEPTLNWENIDYIWCNANDLPSPLHPGIIDMLKVVKLS